MSDRNVHRAGVGLIVAGILLNPLFVGWLFSPDGKMHSISVIICLVLVNVFLLASGSIILRTERNLTLRSLGFAATTVIVVLVALEIGLHLIVHLFDPGHHAINRRLSLSIYRDSAWAPELFSEDASIRSDVVSFVGWRSHEFSGKFIHVDSSGCRMTVQDVRPGDREPAEVSIFGGSSAWGIYARDSQTIPSHLARLLNDRGYPCRITNEAEKGYTFLQGVTRLITLLQQGKRPDLVVFYDGFNDVINAYLSGKAGGLGLTGYLEGLLQLQQESPLKQVGMIVREFVTRHSMIYRGVDRARKLIAGSSDDDLRPPAYNGREQTDLASQVADTYASAHRLLDMLAREYHFSYACFLQPTLYTKASTTREERGLQGLAQDPDAGKFLRESYRQLGARNLAHFFNLSAVLDTCVGTCYSDYCHVSEHCNAVIAGSIADALISSHVLALRNKPDSD